MSQNLFDKIRIVRKCNNPGLVEDAVQAIHDFCENDVPGEVEIVSSLHCDENTLFVALGGDGTVMTACREAARTNSMVIGINHGNLGFLTDFTSADGNIRKLLFNLLRAQKDDYLVEERFLLEGQIGMGDNANSEIAVNEFHITSANHQAVNYRLKIDGIEAAQHTADGVLICSPTGSTAYGLAAGGAIMMPTMRTMQIIPVAPHMLTSRPLIVGEQHTVSVSVDAKRPIIVNADGQAIDIEPSMGEYKIKVRVGRQSVRLIKLNDHKHNFFEVMRDKLYYGRRGN